MKLSDASSDIEQGTEEWYEVRRGKVTGSRVADVIARTKSGYSASRANYMAQLLVERLTGVVQDIPKTDAMRWGSETEPQARERYEAHTGVSVQQVGFVEHPTIANAGASPDGLVGAHGLVEIKCPNTATHIETLLSQRIPAKYITQMQWQMACTQRSWCDFVSFDPRMPENMQLFVTRVDRDEAAIKLQTEEVTKFLNELTKKEFRLRETYA